MALTKEDLQAIRALMREELEPVKEDMQNGFDRLEDLINVAAKDAARTERALREHLESHIA